jgi:adenylosuccinate lyase
VDEPFSAELSGAGISAAELDRLFDPAGYTGEAAAFADRVLQIYHSRKAGFHKE